MSADWKAGDRAVCVNDTWNSGSTHDYDECPKKGNIYLVTGTNVDSRGLVGLFISGCCTWMIKKRFLWPAKKLNEVAWNEGAFRKIVPACDRKSISMTYTQP